jgi:hypothetical protein
MKTVLVIFIAVAWFIFDYAAIPGGLNEAIDKWLKRTLWIWLPFFALYALTKELMLRSQSKK